MFELPEVRVNEFFIKKYYRMFKGPQETVRDNKILSYPVFELPGVNCMFNVNKKKKQKKKRQNDVNDIPCDIPGVFSVNFKHICM